MATKRSRRVSRACTLRPSLRPQSEGGLRGGRVCRLPIVPSRFSRIIAETGNRGAQSLLTSGTRKLARNGVSGKRARPIPRVVGIRESGHKRRSPRFRTAPGQPACPPFPQLSLHPSIPRRNSLVDTPACPRTHLTGVSPGFFHSFSPPTTINWMPAGGPSAERSRSAIATSRLLHRPGPPPDPLRDHTQAGLAILRLLPRNRSARTGPLRTRRRRRPPQYPPGISRNCRQNLNPRELHPGPP